MGVVELREAVIELCLGIRELGVGIPQLLPAGIDGALLAGELRLRLAGSRGERLVKLGEPRLCLRELRGKLHAQLSELARVLGVIGIRKVNDRLQPLLIFGVGLNLTLELGDGAAQGVALFLRLGLLFCELRILGEQLIPALRKARVFRVGLVHSGELLLDLRDLFVVRLYRGGNILECGIRLLELLGLLLDLRLLALQEGLDDGGEGAYRVRGVFDRGRKRIDRRAGGGLIIRVDRLKRGPRRGDALRQGAQLVGKAWDEADHRVLRHGVQTLGELLDIGVQLVDRPGYGIDRLRQLVALLLEGGERLVVELVIRRIERRLAIDELLSRARERFGERTEAIGELGGTLLEQRAVLVDLRLRVVELGLGVGELGEGVRFLVVDLGHGLVFDRLRTRPLALRRQVLHARLHLVHARIVRLGIGRQILRAGNSEVGDGVRGVVLDGAVAHEERVIARGARAERDGAVRLRDVRRVHDGAHDGVRAAGDRAGGRLVGKPGGVVLLGVLELERVADLLTGVLEVLLGHRDLVRGLRQAPLHHIRFVHAVREQRLHGDGCAQAVDEGVRRLLEPTLRLRDAVYRGELGDVLVREAVGGLHGDVEEVLAAVEGTRRRAQVDAGHGEAGEHGRAERADGDDGEEALHAPAYRADDVLREGLHRVAPTIRSGRWASATG